MIVDGGISLWVCLCLVSTVDIYFRLLAQPKKVCRRLKALFIVSFQVNLDENWMHTFSSSLLPFSTRFLFPFHCCCSVTFSSLFWLILALWQRHDEGHSWEILAHNLTEKLTGFQQHPSSSHLTWHFLKAAQTQWRNIHVLFQRFIFNPSWKSWRHRGSVKWIL